MKVFVCQICGEVYIGESVPGSCPFCGVANKNLRLASAWEDNNDVELTEISRKNLEAALKLELSNANFYKCCADNITNIEASKMFKGLFKVEREHASVFRKILKPAKDPEVDDPCIDDPLKMIEESSARETRAIEFYSKALAEAEEDRVKEVIEAIMETEKDHLALDKIMKEKFQ